MKINKSALSEPADAGLRKLSGSTGKGAIDNGD